MIALAVAIQVAPLAGPVLLSTDVYTYWDYGRLSAVHGANPYEDEPSTFPDDPAYPRMGAQWRDTTSVYGPGFTLASEAHAVAVGESAGAAAAWVYALAAAAMVALSPGGRLGSRPVFAAAFVGWNPLLALHFAGGGHNDAWMMAFVLAALALAAAGRRQLAGVAWASIAVKWLPIVFLPLRALEARATRRRLGHLGFAVAATVVAAFAFARYGMAWVEASGRWPTTCATRPATASQTLAQLGLPESVAATLAVLFAGAYVWLLVEAWRGRARLGLCAGSFSSLRRGSCRGTPSGPCPSPRSRTRRPLSRSASRAYLLEAGPSQRTQREQLISIAEAQKRVLERAKRLEAERVPIERAADACWPSRPSPPSTCRSRARRWTGSRCALPTPPARP